MNAKLFALGALGLVSTWSGLGCAPTHGMVRPDHPMLGAELGRDGVAPPSGLAVIVDDGVPDDDSTTTAARERIARTAAASVGRGPVIVDGERFRMDCSGVARGIYAKAGHRLGFVTVDAAAGTRINDTRVLYELVKQTGSLRRSHWATARRRSRLDLRRPWHLRALSGRGERGRPREARDPLDGCRSR